MRYNLSEAADGGVVAVWGCGGVGSVWALGVTLRSMRAPSTRPLERGADLGIKINALLSGTFVQTGASGYWQPHPCEQTKLGVQSKAPPFCRHI